MQAIKSTNQWEINSTQYKVDWLEFNDTFNNSGHIVPDR